MQQTRVHLTDFVEAHASYSHAGYMAQEHIPYSAKFWRGKTLANRSFQTFGEENVGELTIANNIISYFSESGIWLGKILANDVQFAKFAKVFPRQNFALYGMHDRIHCPRASIHSTRHARATPRGTPEAYRTQTDALAWLMHGVKLIKWKGLALSYIHY